MFLPAYTPTGTLAFPGTTVPIKRLFDYRKAGQSLQTFLADHPQVQRQDALAVAWSDPADYLPEPLNTFSFR